MNTRKKLRRIRRRDLKLGWGTTADAVLANDPEIKRLDRYERRAVLYRISAARLLDQTLAGSQQELEIVQNKAKLRLTKTRNESRPYEQSSITKV